MINNFWICINAVIPLLIYLIIGFAIRRAGIISEDEVHRFNRLVFVVCFPAMMFENLYGADLRVAFNLKLVVFALMFLFAYIGASIPLVSRIEKKPESRGALIQAMYRSNYVLMGLPIAINIYGKGNVSVTAFLIAFVVPAYNVLAVIILEYYRGGKTSASNMLRKIITNPIIQGAIAAVIVIMAGIRIPKSVDSVVSAMSDATTPMAMILLGASFNLKSVKTSRRNLSIAVIAKLLVMPGLGLSIAMLLGFRNIEFVSLICMLAAPCAVSSYTMAESMGSDGELAGNAVIFTTTLSVITIFAWLFLFKNLGTF